MQKYYVYILASKPYGVLYIGVTKDLLRRVWEHRDHTEKGFTKKYSVEKLVYFEYCNDIRSAIMREKQLKRWNRQWKIELINKVNPSWRDLYEDIK